MSAKEIQVKTRKRVKPPQKKINFVIPPEWRETLDKIASESPESLATHCRNIFEAGLKQKGLIA